MIKYYVWSVYLYGVNDGTFKTTSINKLNFFKLSTLLRMLKISYNNCVTDKDILRKAILVDSELFGDIKRRKTGGLGHILLRERYHFQRLILQGKIKLKKKRNRLKYTGNEIYENGQEYQTYRN